MLSSAGVGNTYLSSRTTEHQQLSQTQAKSGNCRCWGHTAHSMPAERVDLDKGRKLHEQTDNAVRLVLAMHVTAKTLQISQVLESSRYEYAHMKVVGVIP